MLRTERLSLRPFDAGDVDELHRIFKDPRVREHLLDGEVVLREWVEAEVAASSARFRAGEAGLWIAIPHGEEEPVGFVGYRPFFDPLEMQLLYGLLPTHWGRGLATEAAEAAIAFAFRRLGVEEVRAAVDVPNTASIAVLERLGLREWKRTAEGVAGTAFYRIARDDWSERK